MNYHFIGIGGVGMSALAHILLQKGEKVSGSDLKETKIIEHLRRAGATIYLLQKKEHIKSSQTIIYSSAIKPDNPELKEAFERNLRILHRKELLSELLMPFKPLLITGTHGKTTTSSLLTWVLSCSGLDPSYALGGIPHSFQVNGHFGKGDFFIAEADESDGSFLHHPVYSAIVTNVEKEHLDYWKTFNNLAEGICEFTRKIPQEGFLFLGGEDPILSDLDGIHFGLSKKFPLYAEKFIEAGAKSHFDIIFEGIKYPEIELNLRGKHNILNSLAVFGLCLKLGVLEEEIRVAFKTFEGIKRRCEKIGEIHGIEIYDDYAHHPTEIKALLSGFKTNLGRLIAVFEPHRYTRLKDLFPEFLTCFHEADHTIITDMYSAGETPIKGVTSEHLAAELLKIHPKSVHFIEKKQLVPFLSDFLKPGDVVIMMGAGNITEFGPLLLKSFEHGY